MTQDIIKIDVREKRGSASEKALTPDEVNKLKISLEEDKHRIIFILGCYAGMRTQEICQCRFTWIEKLILNEKQTLAINIPDEDRDSRNKLKIWRPKTKKKRTTYVFDIELLNEVFAWFKNNTNGLQLSRQAIDKIVRFHFAPIINRKELSAHPLRATAQNYLRYEKQFPVSVIQIMLGHSDIRTTEKHYNTLTRASAESYLMNNLN